MDLNQIKKLVKLVESSQIDELEIQEEGLQIRVTKSKSVGGVVMPQQVIQAAPQVAPAPAPQAAPPPAPASASANTVEILSPMVGTFYAAPSPDSAAYVKEGDSIQPGKILCIVEAMKLMNEIEAEISGRIVKVLVENAQPVEYNQPLFLVEKA